MSMMIYLCHLTIPGHHPSKERIQMRILILMTMGLCSKRYHPVQRLLCLFQQGWLRLRIGYLEEVKELKKKLFCEFNTLSDENSKQASILNANQVMNAVYNADIFCSVLGFQNKSLVEWQKEPMDVKEFEIFLWSFFVLCFFCCSLTDVIKHPQSRMILQALKSHGLSLDSKVLRMNGLLWSFEGHANAAPCQGSGEWLHKKRVKTTLIDR